MKWLVLFVWVLIQVVVPTMISGELYATAVQLELAFFALAIWYFNKIFSKEQLSSILTVFGVYYAYIYATDQFITELPNFVVYLEALCVYMILYFKLEDE